MAGEKDDTKSNASGGGLIGYLFGYGGEETAGGEKRKTSRLRTLYRKHKQAILDQAAAPTWGTLEEPLGYIETALSYIGLGPGGGAGDAEGRAPV